ncbi:hypothetical protein GJ654_18775 [Rhodoblastus acidophilus]|uniref:Phage protein, HK97 gp10 family n=2 Tax=Rhodoblastus acidophilus TaxID=1074 RepID=A0A6N8DRV4_RHOAC|nr:hypothetical protein [Rhodoblastus acidophilus]
MAAVQIRIDASQLTTLGNLLGAAGEKSQTAIMRALNHTGKKARIAMVRALVPQTGLKNKTIKKALGQHTAYDGRSGGAARGAYVIKSKGGNIRLKFFKPREGGDGVDASPWNAQHHYAGGFTKVGGGFGKKRRKKTKKFGGNVMRRVGGSRKPLEVVKSGLDIPDEMVTGASASSFYSTVQSDLMPRVFHELLRVIPG